jgi:hypothetical protein
MRKRLYASFVLLWLLGLVPLACAQTKAGLYEVTVRVWTSGTGIPRELTPEMRERAAKRNLMVPGLPYTRLVCVTPEMAGRMNSSPAQQNSTSALRLLGSSTQCSQSDVVRTANGMTGKVACKVAMPGPGSAPGSVTETFGTLTTIDVDGDTQETKIVMNGTRTTGSRADPVEMTAELRRVYKGQDCGQVKPPKPPTP